MHGPLSTVDRTSSSHPSDSQIFVENHAFDLPPPAFAAPPPIRESLSEYCHNVWCGKTRMVWLPNREKKFEDMFIRFDRQNTGTDGQTDGQTLH